MNKLSRRSFFKTAGGAAAVLATHAQARGHESAQHAGTATKQATAYLFFRSDEATVLDAITERLIPADANGPGARQAGVTRYIDRQLAGAWGAGERLYRAGPWQSGQATQGYQLPFTPAELFRNGLRGMGALVQQQYKKTFAQLTNPQQDAFLEKLQNSQQDLEGVPGHVLFESLLAMTIEGFFSDPVYGGNQDMAAWKMIGFPGAYASFYDLVDQHGLAYTREPLSIGDNGRGVIELHPLHAPTAQGPTIHGGS
jgi:gluconate 2-dehydrogenase gamma chain